MKSRPFIVNVGLPRTGHLSLSFALKILGFNSLHFWQPALDSPTLVLEARSNSQLTRRVFSRYAALGEAPFYAMREVFERYYPATLLVYTTIGRERWIDSMIRHPATGRNFLKELYHLPGPPHCANHHEALGAAWDQHHDTVCADLTVIDMDEMSDREKWETIIRALPNSRRYLRNIESVAWPESNEF